MPARSPYSSCADRPVRRQANRAPGDRPCEGDTRGQVLEQAPPSEHRTARPSADAERVIAADRLGHLAEPADLRRPLGVDRCERSAPLGPGPPGVSPSRLRKVSLEPTWYWTITSGRPGSSVTPYFSLKRYRRLKGWADAVARAAGAGAPRAPVSGSWAGWRTGSAPRHARTRARPAAAGRQPRPRKPGDGRPTPSRLATTSRHRLSLMVHRLRCSSPRTGLQPRRCPDDRRRPPRPSIKPYSRRLAVRGGGRRFIAGRAACRGWMPPQRADHLGVLVAEGLGVLRGQGVGDHELVPRRAGDEVIVPDDAEVPLASLHADLEAEPARPGRRRPRPHRCTGRTAGPGRGGSRRGTGSDPGAAPGRPAARPPGCTGRPPARPPAA